MHSCIDRGTSSTASTRHAFWCAANVRPRDPVRRGGPGLPAPDAHSRQASGCARESRGGAPAARALALQGLPRRVAARRHRALGDAAQQVGARYRAPAASPARLPNRHLRRTERRRRKLRLGRCRQPQARSRRGEAALGLPGDAHRWCRDEGVVLTPRPGVFLPGLTRPASASHRRPLLFPARQPDKPPSAGRHLRHLRRLRRRRRRTAGRGVGPRPALARPRVRPRPRVDIHDRARDGRRQDLRAQALRLPRRLRDLARRLCLVHPALARLGRPARLCRPARARRPARRGRPDGQPRERGRDRGRHWRLGRRLLPRLARRRAPDLGHDARHAHDLDGAARRAPERARRLAPPRRAPRPAVVGQHRLHPQRQRRVHVGQGGGEAAGVVCAARRGPEQRAGRGQGAAAVRDECGAWPGAATMVNNKGPGRL